MIQHWTFARGGAWRNPKPTGGLYVCEQCRLDARSGNDSTLTMQAVTAIELAPTPDYARDLNSSEIWTQKKSRSSLI